MIKGICRSLSVVVTLVVLCGSVSQVHARLAQNQFGKNWVRTHPFQLYTASVYEGGTQANGTNINDLLDLHLTGLYCSFEDDLLDASASGLIKHTAPWYPHPLLDDYGNIHPGVIDRANAVSGPDDSDAWYIADEPDPSLVDDCAIVKSWLALNRPYGLAYVNVTTLPSGADIDTLITTANLDAIGTDIYPFCGVISYEITNDYFQTIMEIRQKGLYYGIPYSCWAQAYGYDWGALWPEHYRIASESEMKFNVYSLLTLGYKGIPYYIYNGNSSAELNGNVYSGIYRYMVDDNGDPTSFYTNARTINVEIWKFCKYLRFLESTGVFFVANTGHDESGYYNDAVTGYSAVPLWSTSVDGDPYIQSITLGTPVYNKRDALIGFFQDDSGQRYFMIQNMWRDAGYSSADRYSGVTIGFDGANLPTPGYIYGINPNTGRPEQIALTGGNYLYTGFGGGEGYLYSYEPITLSGKDTVAPKGSIIINSGAGSTTSTSVTLSISASDDSEVDQMHFSNDNVNWSSWETYGTSKAWNLTSGEGAKTVYIQFKDEAGNVSAVSSDSIHLFSGVGITINSGATYTNSSTVSLAMSGPSGSTYMSFSNDNINWSSSETYSTYKAGWTMTSGDGLQTVYVKYYNGSWSSAYSDTITVCSDPGAQVPLNILWRCVNGGDRFTTTLASVRDSYTCEGQVFYIPKNEVSGAQGLYRIFRPSPYDMSDWLSISSGSSFEYNATQGYTWNSQVTGTDSVNYAINWGTGDAATLHPYESISGYSVNSGLGYGYSRYNNTSIDNLIRSDVTNQAVYSNEVAGGAVSGWTFVGVGYNDVINYYSYTRGISSVLAWGGRAAYEAGDYNTARPDITPARQLHGSPCQEAVNYASTSVGGNTRLCQRTWSIPLEGYPFNYGGGADNPVIYKDLKLGKDITLIYNGLTGVSKYVTRVCTPNALTGTRLQMPDACFLGLYSNFYTFDAKNNSITGPISLSYGSGTNFAPSTGYGGIICATGTAGSSQAIGIFGITEGQGGSVTGFQIYNFVTGSSHTKYDSSTAWMRTYRSGNIPAGESGYAVWIVLGTRSEVQTYMRQLVPPAGSILVNNGAASTTTTSVTLNLSATANYGSVVKMMISNDANFTGAAWENYSTNPAWTLTSGTGTKTVYVKFLDNNGTNGDGNVSSVYQDSIELQ